MERLNLTIDGMSCGHCVSAVQRALAALPGVQVERVTVGAATVSHDPAVTNRDAITRAVDGAGYAVAAAFPAGAP